MSAHGFPPRWRAETGQPPPPGSRQGEGPMLKRLLTTTAALAALALPGLAAEPEEVLRRAADLTPLGPWSEGDQMGMGNTQGPGTWMRCAAHLAAPGAKLYELSHIRANDMPQSPFGVPLVYEYRPTVGIPGTRHAATYYGGATQAEVKPTPDSPLLKLGMEQAAPIVTSAVLLDAAAHLNGGAPLEPGTLVTAADIEAMLAAQGLGARGIQPGDVVLIHTGWGALWDDAQASQRYYTMGPGLAQDGAELLAGRHAVLVALDNPFTDPVADGQLTGQAMPPQGMDEGLPFVIHHLNLAVNGIHNIQNARLKEIAADGAWTSCAMILPLRSRGASGSPVRAIAIGAPTR
ncbi:MAG: polyketide cyclase [Alphaproteobacteria bacterium HGW-Alphaproteobacteria-2]|nr:MAG: polyketide cyclase [Alphaproteobacteria bacterium HGW-Alphaproteobacteria-2]